MEKNLLERLVIEAKTGNKKNVRFNLAAFLLMRDEVFKAIDAGWSVRFIWELLYKEEKITFSYQTFLKFVNKYKTKKTEKSTKDVVKKESNTLSKSESEQKPDLASKEVSASEHSQGRIKVTDLPNDPNVDYGNPKGFEWNADYDPKDFI